MNLEQQDDESQSLSGYLGSENRFLCQLNSTPVSNFSDKNFCIFSTENIDFIWCAQYADDIYESLKEIEVKRIKIHYKSPQTEYRWSLVQLIKSVAENLILRRTTVHLAVYMLDCFMDHFKIVVYKLRAIALMCLLLSCKIEESECKIPNLECLRGMVQEDYKKQELKAIESKLLCFFKWYLLYPTGATFLESFITKVITVEEFQIHKLKRPIKHIEFKDYNEIAAHMNTLVFEFLDLTLQECRMVQVLPSLMSASCLAAARKIIGIYPIWSERLKNITGYQYLQIDEIVKTLIHMKTINEEQKCTPDSGFLSDNSDIEDQNQQFFSISCPIPFKRKR